MPSPRTAPSRALRAFAKVVAAATFGLLLAGGMVTSTGSGLAVPDWPLSFGRVMPPMEGGVLWEHGHRMIASAVGLLIVIQAVWVQRAEPRAWVRRLAWVAALGVVVQGLLGGLTVLLRLPDPVSVSHAALAQIVFGLTVAIALALSRGWTEATGGPRPLDTTWPSTFSLAAGTAALVFVQILLGAVVRHAGAGLAIPTFPLAYGQVVPPLESLPVRLHFLHRVGAVVVGIATLVAGLRVATFHRDLPALARPAALLVVLVLAQIGLGGWVILSTKDPWVTTAHLGVGAAIWATALVLALRARHRLRLAPEPSHAPIEPRVDPGLDPGARRLDAVGTGLDPAAAR